MANSSSDHLKSEDFVRMGYSKGFAEGFMGDSRPTSRDSAGSNDTTSPLLEKAQRAGRAAASPYRSAVVEEGAALKEKGVPSWAANVLASAKVRAKYGLTESRASKKIERINSEVGEVHAAAGLPSEFRGTYKSTIRSDGMDQVETSLAKIAMEREENRLEKRGGTIFDGETLAAFQKEMAISLADHLAETRAVSERVTSERVIEAGITKDPGAKDRQDMTRTRPSRASAGHSL